MPTRVTRQLIDEQIKEGESYVCVISYGENNQSFPHLSREGLYHRLEGMTETELKKEEKHVKAYFSVAQFLEKRGKEHYITSKLKAYGELVSRLNSELDEDISEDEQELRDIIASSLAF